MQTVPLAPILARTALGTVEPATEFELDAVGCGDPHGNTVTNPAPAELVVVTFSATAVAVAAPPPRPETFNCIVAPEANGPVAANCASTVVCPRRVSASRAGDSATKSF